MAYRWPCNTTQLGEDLSACLRSMSCTRTQTRCCLDQRRNLARLLQFTRVRLRLPGQGHFDDAIDEFPRAANSHRPHGAAH